GSIQERTFSGSIAQKLIAIIKNEINMPIVIVHGPNGTEKAIELTQCFDNVYHLSLSPSIPRSAAVIKDAFLAITPDTSVLHMTSAYNVPVIAVYADYKTRWPAMADISETIVVGKNIDHINLDEFRNTIKRIIAKIQP
ncbi:lipopolysaccharide heptosyltransferase family protein, partial [Escherichia coli]|nr:lipopolysaccharide heptosyltransferase family protein [Escherichia coli]